jgi:hypothetical protein
VRGPGSEDLGLRCKKVQHPPRQSKDRFVEKGSKPTIAYLHTIGPAQSLAASGHRSVHHKQSSSPLPVADPHEVLLESWSRRTVSEAKADSSAPTSQFDFRMQSMLLLL